MQHPQHIAKYEVISVLGEGAMGMVYKARDPHIERLVAIKTIHPGLAGGDMAEELGTRFLREIRAVGNLRHPNIIAIHDTGEQDGMPFYVMEFVEGRELAALLQDQARFSPAQVLGIGRQLLSALAYTHQRGIIHRDIKPANIFLTAEGDVKVADFGIARVENSELTQMGTSMGTPSYMSPEQCAGQAIDNRSDLFAVAIVLYQLLTGEKPFYGESVHALMHRILNAAAEPPSKLNPALPKAVDRLMERALAKRPDERYQSAEELLQALEMALGGRNPAAARRPFWLWWGLSAVSVYAACLLVFLFWYGLPEPTPATAAISDADIGVAAQSEVAAAPLTAEQRNKVDRFLRLAQLSVDAGRLVWPPGSNAVYVYRLILEIDPGNRDARDGLRHVLETLLARASELQREGDRDALREHLEVSLQAYPDARALRDLRRGLGVAGE